MASLEKIHKNIPFMGIDHERIMYIVAQQKMSSYETWCKGFLWFEDFRQNDWCVTETGLRSYQWGIVSKDKSKTAWYMLPVVIYITNGIISI